MNCLTCNCLDNQPAAFLEASGTLEYFAVQLITASEVGSFHYGFAQPTLESARHARQLAQLAENNPENNLGSIASSARHLYEVRMLLAYVLNHPYREAKKQLHKWKNFASSDANKMPVELYAGSQWELEQITSEDEAFSDFAIPADVANQLDQSIGRHTIYRLLCFYSDPSVGRLPGMPIGDTDRQVAAECFRRAQYYLSTIQHVIAYVVNHLPG